MEPKVNYVVVGIFVVLLGFLLVAVVLWLGKGLDREVYDRYYAYMEESVAGLSVDAAVKYRGVEVGRSEGRRVGQGFRSRWSPYH